MASSYSVEHELSFIARIGRHRDNVSPLMVPEIIRGYLKGLNARVLDFSNTGAVLRETDRAQLRTRAQMLLDRLT